MATYTNGNGTTTPHTATPEIPEIKEEFNFNGERKSRSVKADSSFILEELRLRHQQELEIISAKNKAEIAKIEAEAKAGSMHVEANFNRRMEITGKAMDILERLVTAGIDAGSKADDNAVKALEILATKAPQVLELQATANEKIGLALVELAKVRDASEERITVGLGKFLLKAAELPLMGKLAEGAAQVAAARAAARQAEAKAEQARHEAEAKKAAPKV